MKSGTNKSIIKKQFKFVWNILRQNLISHLKNKDCQGASLIIIGIFPSNLRE